MKLEDYFSFLAPNDIRLKGHRLGIESILYEYLHNEKTAEQIAERFPTLSLAQIYATILYYLHNQAQVEAYLADWLNHWHQMRAEQERNPTPTMLRLRQLRAEHEATKQAA